MALSISCMLHAFFLGCLLSFSNSTCTDLKDCFSKVRPGKLDGYVIKAFSNKGYRDCFKECFRHAIVCGSFNYNKFTGLCELNSRTPDSMTLNDVTTFVNSLVPSVLSTGPCSPNPCSPFELCVVLSSGNTTCVKAMQCSFEEPCLYLQQDINALPFIKRRGPTYTSGTGCSSDHTSGDGYYYYLEASGRSNGDIFRMITINPFPAGQQICVGLWYYMYGNSVKDLFIQIKDLSGHFSDILVATGNQGMEWYTWSTVIEPQPTDVWIAITGVRGTGFMADICFDDVMMHLC